MYLLVCCLNKLQNARCNDKDKDINLSLFNSTMPLWAIEGVEVNSTHSTPVLTVDTRVTMRDRINILEIISLFTYHMYEIPVHVLHYR